MDDKIFIDGDFNGSYGSRVGKGKAKTPKELIKKWKENEKNNIPPITGMEKAWRLKYNEKN